MLTLPASKSLILLQTFLQFIYLLCRTNNNLTYEEPSLLTFLGPHLNYFSRGNDNTVTKQYV